MKIAVFVHVGQPFQNLSDYASDCILWDAFVPFFEVHIDFEYILIKKFEDQI